MANLTTKVLDSEIWALGATTRILFLAIAFRADENFMVRVRSDVALAAMANLTPAEARASIKILLCGVLEEVPGSGNGGPSLRICDGYHYLFDSSEDLRRKKDRERKAKKRAERNELSR